ncbi:MAG: 2-oxoglutarate oxidoreductase [Anaerolineales bacterium]|nr:2-oxoglutarate oxidoreductase [Anaerolineales bacterium]
MRALFVRPSSLIGLPFSYCPGCSHGILHRLVAQAMDDLNLRERAIGITPAGCSVRMWRHFDCDMIQALHGRGPALATGLKRALPDRAVWVYQGDGDIAAIGMAHIIHAAARGERISVIFLNNGCFGATGGQMAPTTLVDQPTTTSPQGRDPDWAGYPIRVAELLTGLDAPAYIARVALYNPANIRQAQRTIRRAFEVQINSEGFSLVEVLGVCPVNLHLDPPEAIDWGEQNMAYYPLGEFKLP